MGVIDDVNSCRRRGPHRAFLGARDVGEHCVPSAGLVYAASKPMKQPVLWPRSDTGLSSMTDEEKHRTLGGSGLFSLGGCPFDPNVASLPQQTSMMVKRLPFEGEVSPVKRNKRGAHTAQRLRQAGRTLMMTTRFTSQRHHSPTGRLGEASII